jgi:hypothetical protein
MYSDQQLCSKISDMFPEIGECGINIQVTHDDDQKAWIVDLKKGSHELKHFLDYPDADNCMEGKQCVSLGLEIAQLKKHITGEQF